MRTRQIPARSPRSAAFTLVEIALALGVAAFSLVAILGMLPIALDNSRDSRLQTRAVFISRGIFDDLKAGSDGKAIVKIANTGSSSDFEIIEASTALDRTLSLAYDLDGNLLGKAGNYQTGSGMPASATFVAQLHLVKVADQPAMAELSIETPATANQQNRKLYLFRTNLIF